MNAHLETGDIERVRKAMYHEQRKQLPTLPNSCTETHNCIDQHQVTSCRGEPMIHVNDVAKGIIILTTRTNMQLLCDRNAQIFGDGTFNFQDVATFLLPAVYSTCLQKWTLCTLRVRSAALESSRCVHRHVRAHQDYG